MIDFYVKAQLSRKKLHVEEWNFLNIRFYTQALVALNCYEYLGICESIKTINSIDESCTNMFHKRSFKTLSLSPMTIAF